jgi:hypothetical protein
MSAIAADIPRRQPRYKRYHRPVAKIAAEEVKLLKHFARFNRDPYATPRAGSVGTGWGVRRRARACGIGA